MANFRPSRVAAHYNTGETFDASSRASETNSDMNHVFKIGGKLESSTLTVMSDMNGVNSAKVTSRGSTWVDATYGLDKVNSGFLAGLKKGDIFMYFYYRT